jgi:hypothetical protein
MDYQRDEQGSLVDSVEPEQMVDLPATTKASVALSGLLATGVLDGVAHLGLAGVVVGTVLTGILVAESPRLVRKLQQDFPEVYAWVEERWRKRDPSRTEGEWSDEYDEKEITAFLADWQVAQQRAGQQGNHQVEEHQDVVLHLSPSWTPSVNSFLSQRIAILGQSGSGKGNTIADLVEEIGPLGVPQLLLDTEDEYSSLCQPCYLPRGVTVGAEHLTVENARAFGQSILADKLQVIVNLHSYESDDEAALVMCELIAGITEWEEALPISQRVSCLVILDEAAMWLPQSTGESILSKDVLARLQQTFFRTVVRRGRKRGIGFVLATQRIAEIDKRALSATWMILHRQTLPNDLRVYKEYGIAPEAARSLRSGQAYVLGPEGLCEVVQFRRRQSSDQAFTPGLASVRRHAPQRPVRPAFSMQQSARTRARERRLRGLPPQRMSTRQSAPRTGETSDTKTRQITPADLAKAFALWQEGYASVRKLESAARARGYGWSNGMCRALIAAMSAQGLLSKREERGGETVL